MEQREGLRRNGIRLTAIGELHRLPPQLRSLLEEIKGDSPSSVFRGSSTVEEGGDGSATNERGGAGVVENSPAGGVINANGGAAVLEEEKIAALFGGGGAVVEGKASILSEGGRSLVRTEEASVRGEGRRRLLVVFKEEIYVLSEEVVLFHMEEVSVLSE